MDVLLLAAKYGSFLLPVVNSSNKVIGYERLGPLATLARCGSLPRKSDKPYPGLLHHLSRARSPLVLLSEGTTSNNRALLKPVPIVLGSTKSDGRVFVVTLVHDAPTVYCPSAASAIRGPLAQIFTINSALSLRTVVVHVVGPPDTPKLQSGDLAEAASRVQAFSSKLKLLASSISDKAKFLDAWARR